MLQAVRRAKEFGPPDDYVHDSQMDADEPDEEHPSQNRLALMVERRQSTDALLQKKPMTSIESRQHARLAEKHTKQLESKCVEIFN